MAEPDVLPRVLSGRYRLEATIGHGGMGVVYRGTDLATQRPVAVKLIRSMDGNPLDEEVAGRFLREAKHTARLKHEHIIEVLDLGQTDGHGLYFVMELLTGESLAQRLRRENKLSPVATVHIARQICEALQVAHTAGVVHRDLKPANIMLLPVGGRSDFVKVLDFGVAKSVGPDKHDETQLTHTGMLVGTIDYMAPEQIMGKPLDGRADVYSLGIMLYRMLAGKAPFKDNGVAQLIHAHMNTLPKPLMEVVEGIPNELDLVILRCLAKNPERRFESMAELARALVHAVPEAAPPKKDSEDDVYAIEDVYGDDDKTAVGRSLLEPSAPSHPSPHAGRTQPPPEHLKAPPPSVVLPPVSGKSGLPVLSDVTVNGWGDDRSHEDATIALDRGFPMPAGPPGVGPQNVPPPRGLPRPLPPPPLESSEGARSPRICAMCQTMNAPHARACAACGVVLPSDEVEIARAPMSVVVKPASTARVGGISTPTVAITPVGTPRMPHPNPHDGYDPSRGSMPVYPTHPMPFGPAPHSQHGRGGVQTWGGSPAPQQPPPPSFWQRFLVWTGLRSR